ncbi:MAG: T9SS type A sorting domain-containing protein [Calditrichaeota bacterium]|nr:T9SS type A sorting domain-containing protein [Calditrichota bacterium]
MKKSFSKAIVFIGITLLFSLPGFAQWVNTPGSNTAIADTAGEQILPKIGATSDGGAFISWYDSRGGNGMYKIYLQRINKKGEPQWQANGMLVSDEPSMTFVTDYDMAVDADDNAIVVFADVRNGADLDVFAYKIDSDGNFVWSADGVELSTIGDFNASPKVVVTDAGNYVFVWPGSDTLQHIGMQKLSNDGQKMWGETEKTIEPAASHNLSYPDAVPALGDDVIVIWTDYTGPFFSPITNDIFTQKFDADGNPKWDAANVGVYTGLSGLPGYEWPHLISDHNGGAFYSWYADRDGNNLFEAFVHHIDSSGTAVFAENGISASTLGSMHHISPALAFMPATGELFAYWIEENGLQSVFGIYGQKFSAQGERLWPDDGKMFLAVADPEIQGLTPIAGSDEIYVTYLRRPSGSFSLMNLYAMITDRNGNVVGNEPVLLSDAASSKGSLVGAVSSHNVLMSAWDDERNDGGAIYAQNLNPDGSLGYQALPVSFAITSPSDSSEWTQLPVPVTFTVANFTVDSTNGDGYIRALLNGSPLANVVNTDTLWLDTLEVGNNELVLELVDPEGNPLSPAISDTVVLIYTEPLAIEPGTGVARSFALAQNYPNPFNPGTTIAFELPQSAKIELGVFDITGRKVATIAAGNYAAGHYSLNFDAKNLASGVYFYRLTAENSVRLTRKMMILK